MQLKIKGEVVFDILGLDQYDREVMEDYVNTNQVMQIGGVCDEEEDEEKEMLWGTFQEAMESIEERLAGFMDQLILTCEPYSKVYEDG